MPSDTAPHQRTDSPHRPDTDRRSARTGPALSRRGLTLVELLIVIAIIGILAALTLTVASRVTGAGRERLTENVIRVLDQTVDVYVAERDTLPPAHLRNYRPDDTGSGSWCIPIIDGRLQDQDRRSSVSGEQFFERPPSARESYYLSDPAQPTVMLYLLATKDVPGIEQTLQGLDARLIEFIDDDEGPPYDERYRAWGWDDNGSFDRVRIRGLVIRDGFGYPIRFVHPQFHGGAWYYYDSTSNSVTADGRPSGSEGRSVSDPCRENGAVSRWSRSYRPFGLPPPGSTVPQSPYGPVEVSNPVGDADEGLAPGGRPYFYSAGRDGDPGNRDTNVYTTRPVFGEEKSRQLH